MKIDKLEFNMFGENTYIVSDPETKECAVVDPGMVSRQECERLVNYIEVNGLKLKYIVCTHLHVDHVFGVKFLKEKYGVELYADKSDEFLSERIGQQLRMFRIPIDMEGFAIDHYITDGDTLYLGKNELRVISVPGHSPGSVALYDSTDKFVITGDALFQGGIGRTDLPGGDYATLINAIRNNLFKLPSDTTVFPGHGPSTTIGYEKQYNPYL